MDLANQEKQKNPFLYTGKPGKKPRKLTKKEQQNLDKITKIVINIISITLTGITVAIATLTITFIIALALTIWIGLTGVILHALSIFGYATYTTETTIIIGTGLGILTLLFSYAKFQKKMKK